MTWTVGRVLVELRYRSLVQNCARVKGKPEVNWRNQAITPLTARLGSDVSHRQDDCVSNPHRYLEDARTYVLAEECRPASGTRDPLTAHRPLRSVAAATSLRTGL